MATNQDQLAAVIGHEVVHVTARHANERASRAALTGVGVDIAAIILAVATETRRKVREGFYWSSSRVIKSIQSFTRVRSRYH